MTEETFGGHTWSSLPLKARQPPALDEVSYSFAYLSLEGFQGWRFLSYPK